MSTIRGSPHASDATLSLPTLVDGYFDARLNDRVRAFLLARLSTDPTINSSATPFPGVTTTATPTALLLDQLWMRFDIERTVFVTAGRQHVKWGTGHFWNPTDFLHLTPRNPLAQFDARTGLTMLKLHVPWEARGWNFYGITYMDETAPTGMVGGMGGAGRAEFVLGPAELGLDAQGQLHQKPRLGGDLSFGVGPFDLYAEAALRKGSVVPVWSYIGTPTPSPRGGPINPLDYYQASEPTGWNQSITAGGTWSAKVGDQGQFTLGAEFAFNSLGYSDPRVYPALFFTGQFVPFYLGKRYGGVYASIVHPWTWINTTFILTTIGNLADSSYVTRLDYLVTVLTNMGVEAYVAAHYGTREGEFRLGFSIPQYNYSVSPIVGEAGLALRVNI